MWKILQQKKPNDWVLSNDETHTVKEFVVRAFERVELDWKKYVKTDKKYHRILEVNLLKGDSSKAKKAFNWNPKIKFEKLVDILVDEDLERWEKGEKFPWDAPNYLTEEKTLFRKPE